MKRPLVLAAIVALLASTSTFLIKASAPQVPSNTWAPAGDMAKGRSGASSVLLYDGRVLVTGGMTAAGATASAERYSPSAQGFLATPAMENARANHSSTLLPDGRVLVAGGVGADGRALSAAEIYDPVANAWTAASPMYRARAGHSATTMYDGRILIAGGDDGAAPTASLEVFDPESGVFNLVTPVLTSARTGHGASLLYDGRVLITGGFDGTNALASTNVYDPYENTVVAGPTLATPRAGHSATTLLDGTVAVIGGASNSGELASAEVYDPSAGTFSAAGSMATARQRHQAILLPHNGVVLIAGGTASGNAVASAELFVPWRGAFVATNAPAAARAWATSAALSFVPGLTIRTGPNDGLVLLAGGSASSDASNPIASAELYGFATVTTDQADYAPGSTVTIRGAGWKPGETVTLTLVESPLRDTHTLTPVVADATGHFVSTEFSPDQDDVDIRFFLTAAGAKSKWEAQTSFTDASGDGQMSISPKTATGGATVSPFTFTFTSAGTFGSGSQVSVTVPAGWTAPQSSSSGSAGYIAVNRGSCSSVAIPAGGISGSGPWTILLNITCGNGNTFTMTYSTVTVPATNASPANNTYQFTTQTKQASAGTPLANIVTQPTVAVSGPGAQLVFTQQPGASSTGGAAFAPQPQVTIKDIAGNTMTGDNRQVTLAITSGTGTQWEFSSAHSDTVVGSPTLSAGKVTFTVPANATELLKF